MTALSRRQAVLTQSYVARIGRWSTMTLERTGVK